MDEMHQFWWNWSVRFGAMIATFTAVLVALFGELFRSKVFPPLLDMQLLSLEGEKGIIKYFSKDGTVVRSEDARYYHVRITNRRRFTPAHNVQVFLIRLEEPGPDGQFRVVWAGEIPMRWRNHEINPSSMTIGHSVDCDLCTVGRDKWLSLSPLIVPHTLNAIRQDKCNLIVSLQTRSDKADSSICRIRVSWDGQWEDGDKEMKQHLAVTQLSPLPIDTLTAGNGKVEAKY
jgi:hypothetical protein